MKALFISYNGALEPLIKSQGIPYLEELSRRKTKCFLLTFEKFSPNKKLFKEAARRLKVELAGKNITWYYLKYHKSPTIPATFFDLMMGIIVTIYIIVFKGIDIVHSRACTAGVIGFIAARITAKRFLLDERGLMAEEYADGNLWKKNGLIYNITLFVEKHLLVKSDAVVVLTENIRDFLLTSNYLYSELVQKKQEFTVIPCCVDLKRFNISSGSDRVFVSENSLIKKFIILYSGSLGTWYLLEEMIDFFYYAKMQIQNAHFLFLTHYNHENILNVWKNNNLSPEDLTIKSAAYENMPKLIQTADCGIFFIKPSLSKRSSCPIKFAEYLACGLPVIINSGIGDTDIITETNKIGVVVKRFGRADYMSCIADLQEIIKKKNILRQRCYNVAQSLFRLEAGAERYFQVYRKLSNRINNESFFH